MKEGRPGGEAATQAALAAELRHTVGQNLQLDIFVKWPIFDLYIVDFSHKKVSSEVNCKIADEQCRA